MNEVQSCNCHTKPKRELMKTLQDVINNYKDKPGSLIPILQIAQNLFGYLPEDVLKYIATGLDKSYNEIAGVVSFYSFFSTQPQGKHLVRVCLGTACYVRGGKEIVNSLEKALDIHVGETTKDNLFSLNIGRCFGACGLAPVLMVNDVTHQRVKTDKINDLLYQYKNINNEKEEEKVNE
jgi:NADH:ubiquinone oxidoreductase subunit E